MLANMRAGGPVFQIVTIRIFCPIFQIEGPRFEGRLTARHDCQGHDFVSPAPPDPCAIGCSTPSFRRIPHWDRFKTKMALLHRSEREMARAELTLARPCVPPITCTLACGLTRRIMYFRRSILCRALLYRVSNTFCVL
jgi:hypothetical protein